MSGCKDRLINIPINDTDVINSVQRLPRTPTEAGLVEIKLKRKLEYNNYHKKEIVDPKKIFTALNFLKRNNHNTSQCSQSLRFQLFSVQTEIQKIPQPEETDS